MQVWIFLLLAALHVSEGCVLENKDGTVTITAYTGGSVLLPCYCNDLSANPETFIWKKQIRNTWKEMSSESDQYRNRVQLANDHSPGNLSLLISHLTKEDGGYYQCVVKDFGHTYIRLTVKGCTPENRETSLTITAHTGESVLLPCSCSDLRTKPETFMWEKNPAPKNTWKGISTESDHRLQLFNDHSPGNLSLLISHLTEEDGGWYKCVLNKYEYLIQLTVEGCTLENKGPRLTVTAPRGGSVLLPCYCTDLQKRPETFNWRKYNTTRNIWEEISSESDQYRNRVQFNDHSPGNLSLLISHLTDKDGGEYRCELEPHKFKDTILNIRVVNSRTESSTTKTFQKGTDQSSQDRPTGPTNINTDFFIYGAVGGFLLLMVLGGVICWRHRAQKRGPRESTESNTQQGRGQETQESPNALYSTIPSEHADNAEQKQNDPEGMYASVNLQSKHKKVQEQDDVTYSSINHSSASTPAHKIMDTGESTEYASIKLK